MSETNSTLKNHDVTIKNLETQMGQISRQLSKRKQGKLFSETIVNPKEQCHAITLRSGKDVSPPPSEIEDQMVEKEEPPKKKLSGDKYLDMDPSDYRESYTIKIGCDDPKDLPPKKTRKQLLEESVDYEKHSPFVKARFLSQKGL
jgi:hypothetical protein